MQRITISLPDDLATLLKREAERRQTSASDVVRTCVTAVLLEKGERALPWAGAVHEPTLAYGADVDEELEQEKWDDEIAGDR